MMKKSNLDKAFALCFCAVPAECYVIRVFFFEYTGVCRQI
ncbi:hypothetical protein CLOSYM_00825 [[Clostridium] symbiosum ATCC 14940]|uniref:Uncharacterized protein n=1 Tax=[Clostridium] symbiosum ATCC 14940 TaxID=411472 RepID=A0ABC9U1Q1_CLOSY|nr:hypothetical protein CLOSYM_00825 [[Clostridium] symbiosum ATCC 14940]